MKIQLFIMFILGSSMGFSITRLWYLNNPSYQPIHIPGNCTEMVPYCMTMDTDINTEEFSNYMGTHCLELHYSLSCPAP